MADTSKIESGLINASESDVRFTKLCSWDYIALVACMVVLNVYWLQNARFYVIHGTPLVSFINHFHENELYNSGLLVKGFEHYYTYYFKIAALLSDYMSIENVVSLMSLMPGVVIVPAVFMVGYAVSDNKYVGYLTVMILLTHWQLSVSLGGGEGFGNNLAHASFATSFLILSYALFLKCYHWLAFLIAGAMINIHAPLAFIMIGLLLAGSLTDKPLKIKKLIGLVAMSLLIGLPTFAWYMRAAQMSTNDSSAYLAQWKLLNDLRSNHSLPSNWYLGTYIRFAAFGIIIVFLDAVRSRMSKPIFVKILVAIIAIVSMCVVGFVFVDLYKIPFVTQLSLFRSTRFFIMLSAGVLATYIVTKAKKDEAMKIESILTSLLIIALVTWNVKIAAGLEMLVFAWLSLKYRSLKYLVAFAAICAICLAGVIIIPKGHIYPIFDSPELFFAVLAMTVIFFVLMLFCSKWRRWLPAAGFTAVFVVLAAMGSFDGYSGEQKQRLEAQKAAQIWTGNNTLQMSTILVPPDIFGWENYSNRSNYLNFIDLAAGFYNPELTVDIMKRVSDYGIDLKTFRDSGELYWGMYEKYYDGDDKSIKSLARVYNMSVMVIETAKQKKGYGFPLVYENDYFRVYGLNSDLNVVMKED